MADIGKTGEKTYCLVKPITDIFNDIGDSYQAKYIDSYLKIFKAKSYIIENYYIDKDYLIDYSNFYARSFDVDDKHTKRVHFFSDDISSDRLKEIMNKFEPNEYDSFKNAYLGFLVLRPIKDKLGRYYIGRTLLKTYPEKDGDERRYYLFQEYPVSLFGVSLSVKTLPFIAQDSAVGGCATSACWVALHPLHTLFGVQKCAPSELTELSITFPNIGRNYPSTGLTIFQMKSQFNALGLETEIINVLNRKMCKLYTINDDIVADAVKAFNNLGLPVIAVLQLLKNGKEDYHAVVIAGYRHKYDKVTELYVHDDQIGPFHKIFPDGNFSKWKNDWINIFQYDSVNVYKLIIPIYSKLRLKFSYIYEIYLKIKRDIEFINSSYNRCVTVELLLISLNTYKNYILNYNIPDKLNVLQRPLPRFLWLIRSKEKDQLINDLVYDGTAVYPKLLLNIDYGVGQKDKK